MKRMIAGVATAVCMLAAGAYAGEVRTVDSLGNEINLGHPPQRVVSLVPSATEVLFELGVNDAVAGLTYHDATLAGAGDKAVIGGYFLPSIEKVRALDPDLVILSRFQSQAAAALKDLGYPLFLYETRSVDQAYQNILALGALFQKTAAARDIVRQNREELALIQKKVKKAASGEPRRVMRLMGRDRIMTPGNDSFQNALIRLAGGMPPDFGKKGPVVDVNLDEWLAFNPQVIYGCGNDRLTAETFFSQEGWKEVDAVKNGRVFYFPCELTCRAATRTGYFVAWLSSMIYTREYAAPASHILPMEKTGATPLNLDLSYVETAEVTRTRIMDFENKTVVIRFKRPQAVLSTLEGERSGILAVGNHYSPPPTWGPGHYKGIEKIRADILAANSLDRATTAFLITGADMDNISVQRASFKEMAVTVAATAGVLDNAVRMSRDIGKYYEPGTINIIIMTNMKLSKRAMAKGIISATEAKTAAMEDMDIRSTYSGLPHPATGTGTDNILMVQGEGTPIQNAGGHSKMGELIARAVYDAVIEAVYKQDKLTRGRHIFQRFKERRLSLYGLASGAACDCMHQHGIEKREFAEKVEHLLLEPAYAGFMESALSLSDDYERGLVKDLSAFELWCRTIAGQIAGRDITKIRDLVSDDRVPRVLETALNALFTGALDGLRHE